MSEYEKFYEDYDFGKESVFSSAFPLPEEGIEARFKPEIDMIMAAGPQSVSHETGSIYLQPELTALAIDEMPASSERYSAQTRNFVVRSLTDGAPLNYLLLQLDQSTEGVDSFSVKIVPHRTSGKQFVTYELRGVIDDDIEKAIFELSSYDEISHDETSSLIIEQDTANDLLLGLIEQAHGSTVKNKGLEENLLTLLGGAKEVDISQTASYSPESKPNIEVLLSRRQRISKGLSTTTFLSITMIDQGMYPKDDNLVRKLKLLQRTEATDSSATFDVLNKLSHLGHEEKASMYETEATNFRTTPDTLYDSLKSNVREIAYQLSGENGFNSPDTGA